MLLYGDYMKEELRKQYKLLRLKISDDYKKEKSLNASDIFLRHELYNGSRIIMSYKPLGKEIDTELIMNRAYRDGKKIILPVTDYDTGIITPCYADESVDFIKGAFSIEEPLEKIAADINDADVVLVPGIAFDRAGNRIGFGKGCYDMLLKNYKGIKIGYCYKFQIADYIPSDEYDIKMDYILCEEEIIICDKEN